MPSKQRRAKIPANIVESKTTVPSSQQKEIIPHSEHGINPKAISKNALKVAAKLQDHGFESYIVGGAVRDLLANGNPKDFDVATNAKPEEIAKIFKNCRLIGRRFRLAHVYCGHELIEVATFRGNHPPRHALNKAPDKDQSRVSAKGQLTRDNVYGSLSEDALRRDFTINALYYSQKDHTVLDYTEGFKDLRDKKIKLIGDPLQRYQEDPVRMLRAIRFSAKLKFDIEEKTEKPINQQRRLLYEIPPARLFDEIIKLFHNSEASEIYPLLRKHGLFETLFPSAEIAIKKDTYAEKMFELAIENTCDRIRVNKPVTIAYLYAVLLWPEFQHRMSFHAMDRPNFQLIAKEAYGVIKKQSQISSIPKRFAFAIKDIWEYQFRLPYRFGKRSYWLLEQKRFRAAFDFLELREQAGEIEPGLASWWHEFQFADENTQAKMVNSLNQPSKPKNLRNRRKQPHKRR